MSYLWAAPISGSAELLFLLSDMISFKEGIPLIKFGNCFTAAAWSMQQSAQLCGQMWELLWLGNLMAPVGISCTGMAFRISTGNGSNSKKYYAQERPKLWAFTIIYL